MTDGGSKLAGSVHADRSYRLSRAIHWTSVALVVTAVVTALLGGLDPHGSGNGAFLWHSSLGIALYLLTIARVVLWFFYRPARGSAQPAADATAASRTLRIAFYALLIALPVSGWILASEEGMHSSLFWLPALPQWLNEGLPRHTSSASDTTAVVVLGRVHGGLAAALMVVVAAHLLAAIRGRRSL